MSKFFEEIFKDFKKILEGSVFEIIALTEKYSPGKYLVSLFVSNGHWLNSNLIEADLNSLMERKAP